MKICNKCKVEKSLESFRLKKVRGTYKPNSICKDCESKQKKEYYLNNRSDVLKRRKETIITPEAKEKRKKYLERYREENKEEIKEKLQKYYKENKEEFKEKLQKYYKENKEEFKEKFQKYYKENKEEFKEKFQKYYKENSEQLLKKASEYKKTKEGKISSRASTSKRRNASLDSDDGTITKHSLDALLQIQNNQCFYCKKDLSLLTNREVHLDHYIPLSKGGAHSITNVVWSCSSCNLQKHNKILDNPLSQVHLESLNKLLSETSLN